MRYARWLAAWVLFWLGHFASKLMHIPGLHWFYPAYNRLMIWSSDIQAEEFGPWRTPS